MQITVCQPVVGKDPGDCAPHRRPQQRAGQDASWPNLSCSRLYPLGVEDVSDLLGQYRAVLEEMHNNRIESGGQPRKWNRLVDKMQGLQLRLRESAEGRQGITNLALQDENSTVRSWSAVNALAWNASKVRPVLEQQAADSASLGGLDATMALREYEAGRLNTAWQPEHG